MTDEHAAEALLLTERAERAEARIAAAISYLDLHNPHGRMVLELHSILDAGISDEQPAATPESSPHEWGSRIADERLRQIAMGYDREHDRRQGVGHLLIQSIDYGRRGRPLEAAALADAAYGVHLAERRERSAVPPEAEVEAAARATYERRPWHNPVGGPYQWDELLDEFRDLWRDAARAALVAARDVKGVEA